MAKKINLKMTPKNYAKIGILAAAVIAAIGGGMFAIKGFSGGGSTASLGDALVGVSGESLSASDINIAVLRMDFIQQNAKVLEDLRKQRETFETTLRNEVERTQKALEREREEIEKSQEVLSRDALQRRVVEYQQKVQTFQRAVTEKAQAIEGAFQRTLVEIQNRHLDPIVNGIIERKKLTIVMDGRFVRIGANAPAALDITNDVTKALDKKVTRFQMERPQGL